jgi:hypothetical protein
MNRYTRGKYLLSFQLIFSDMLILLDLDHAAFFNDSQPMYHIVACMAHQWFLTNLKFG